MPWFSPLLLREISVSMSKSPRHRRPLIEVLEPRLLFSATADIAVFDDGASDGQYLAQAAARTDLVSIYMPSDPVMMESQTFDGDPQADLAPSETPTVTTLVFVDTAVDNYETLVDDIRARVDANSVAIVYLDSSKEGLDQISDYLAGASGISAIHIISHGVAGNLQLGNQVLNENNINQFKEQLTGWQTALGADADILLYGCDLAANQSGVNFLGELSELTGADVAASNDLTGNSRADADWVLEERIGIVETESLFAANEPMAWQGVLADIVHLNSGAPTNEERIPTGSDIKQGIQLTSSQTVDRVQITLANHGTASSSVIMTVHESTYDGPVIATASVNTASLGGTLGTVNFDFSAVTFNAYTIYWVEFRTNDAADNLVGLGYINSNVITSEFVVNNVGDSSRDMSIAIIDVQNQAPTVANAIPNQNATEDSVFNFQFAANTFADVDVGNTLTYTAQLAGGGALPAWLSFDAATRTFSGTPLNANVGTVAIDVIANDGNGGTVTDTFDIVVANVNDAPTVSIALTDYYTNEQTAVNLHGTGITVNDVDSNTVTVTIAGPAPHSQLTADVGTTGATISSGNGTPSLVVTGTLNQVNAFLAGNNGGTLTFRMAGDTPVATATLTITANDGALSGNDTATINITALNDAPANTVPGAQATDEDTALVFSAGNGNQIQVDDVDEGAGDLEVTLSVTNGTLTLAGVAGLVFTTGDGTSDSSMVFRGTQADINTAIATLTFAPTANYNGAAVLSITTSDLGNTGTGGVLTDTDNVNITVNAINDAPVNTVPGAQVTNKNVPITFSAGNSNQIQIADIDAGAATNIEVTLSVSNGVLTLAQTTNLTMVAGDGTADSTLVFRGTVADLNAALATLTFTPANNYTGGDTLSITTKDQGNTGAGGILMDQDLVGITINNNQVPTVSNAIPNQNATEDAPFSFQFAANTFADGDVGDTLTYTAQLAGGGALPAWLSFNAATRTFSGTPTNAFVGTVSIDVIANDGIGGTVTDTFDIVVANTNDGPTVANPIPNQNATEDAAFNFQFALNTFADVDVGDTLTYTAPLAGGGTLPGWLSFNAATRTFSGTPTNTDLGTLTIAVTASDGLGGTVTETFDILVANTNDAPTVVFPIADQNATENSAFSFTFGANVFADEDAGDTLTFSAQLVGGAPLPAWLSFDAVTRTFSGTPAASDSGTLAIQITASDGNGGSIAESFNLTTSNLPVNAPPFVQNIIADQLVAEDSPLLFTLPAATFVDPEGDLLSYSVQLVGGAPLPAWLSFDAVTRTFSGTPANGDVGVIDVQVTVSDGNGGTVSDRFTITVANTNDAPLLVNAIPHQNATEGTTFNFQFNSNTFVDEDPGANLTYNAQLADGGALPAWLSFDAATRTFSGTPAQGDTGNLVIHIIASDSIATVMARFQLAVVAVNDVPQTAGSVVIDNLEDAAGDQVDLWAAFSDQETASRDLAFSIVGNSNPTLVSGASIDPVTGKLQLRYGVNQFGSADLVVRAQDQQGAWVETLVRVNIESVNDVPVSSGIADITVQAGAVAQQINVQGAFNDVENGRALAWTLVENSNSAVATSVQIDPATGLMALAFSSQSGGDSTITLRAQDSDGAWVETRFKVTVTPAEVLPPPVSPPVTPPVEAPVPPMVPPAIPPTVPPTAEVPDGAGNGTDELPNLGGNDGTGITPPGIAGQPLAVDTGDSERPESGYKDKSSRDIERAEEMLSGDNIPLTTLTASTNLASLIAPDAGFAPWEEADFDNDVRRLRAQMDEAMLEEQDRKAVVAGITFSVTTGLLVWSLRASSLLLTMMSMLPLWRGLDPLPILDEVNKKKKELEQQRKDREREDKSAKEVGYLFDHAQRKEPRR